MRLLTTTRPLVFWISLVKRSFFLLLLCCTLFLQRHSAVEGFTMSQSSLPQNMQHLILVGGGHAHAQVITALNDATRPSQLRVTLIDPQASATYSGMVPGCIGGHYTFDETQIDLQALAQWAGMAFLQDRVMDIDLEQQCVYLEHMNEPLYYDAISLDVGSTTRGWSTTPGAKEYTIPTRPIDALVRRLQDESTDAPVQLVVVGAGAAGMELSMTVTSRWKQVACTVLDAGNQLLPLENDECRRMLQRKLTKRKITVRHDAYVAHVTAHHVVLQDDTKLPYTHCIWAAGAEAHTLAKHLQEQRGLACTEHGWIQVQPTLQSTSHPSVFAAGDCASIEGLARGPPPKAGVYAVRAGPVLVQNILHYLEQRPEEEWTVYEPQEDFLKLLVCGEGRAMGFRFGLPFYGKWVFDMKDQIDRNFMNLFVTSKLPDKSLLKRGDYRIQQYDAVLEDSLPLQPNEAAILLQRSDDYVDYQLAWSVLRAMARDKLYQEQVLHCVYSCDIATL